MKVTQKQLNELIYLITRGVVKEYGLMSSQDDEESTQGTADTGAKPTDAMTTYEKSKAEREAKKKQQDALRTAKFDLDMTKKQTDYFKAQDKKNTLDIQAKTKNIQQLSGAPKGIVPAGGTIAEIVRKVRSKI
jgi:hypothetical protein